MDTEGEISFDETPAEKVTAFFEKPIAEAVAPALPGPESVDDLAETPMAWKELCEPMLKELHGVVEKRKHFTDYEKELKEEVRKFVGKDRGMVQRGAYGVKVDEVAGRTVTEWERAIIMIRYYVRDQIGEAAMKEVEKIVASCRTQGAPTVKLSPYRVGAEPKEDD
jgi:hypothetical protein